ncbi:hypothetical protein EMGBD2_13920 [Nitrospirota bacterium]|nr:hypothetical protein EMGBD2_13920 [Nitrospirota bacterium]
MSKDESPHNLQDYGIDGWKASREVLEATFLKIIEKTLDRQRQAARADERSCVSHMAP